MARRYMTDELLHCNECGEDYSSTYRRCPFCGERPVVRPAPAPVENDDDFDDGYVFDGQDLFDDEPAPGKPASKGGKRLASGGVRTARASRYDPPAPTNWARTLTFGLALLLTIVALIIVFTVIYPMLHTDPNNTGAEPPVGSQIVDTGDVEPHPTDTAPEQTDDPVTDPPLTSLTLNSHEFTLMVDETFTIVATLDPADWTGELTWTSSDEAYATVDENGLVTNVNETTALRRVTITVSGGGQTAEVIVFCRGVDSDPNAGNVDNPEPEPTDTDTTPDNGELAAGTVGHVVGATGGLNVRSGPGTDYSRVASLLNGAQVTVLEYAGDDWYKIWFYGTDGRTEGYIMGEYIGVD